MGVILKYVTGRDYVIGGLAVIVLYLLTAWHATSVELKKAKLAYEHPEVKTIERIVYKQGPIRIVTRIKEVPSGVKETVIVEEHAPIVEEVVKSSQTTTVPLAVVTAPARTDRYLVSVGLNRLTSEVDGKALFVGYGIKNRFDIQIGGVEHDGFSPWILGTLRF